MTTESLLYISFVIYLMVMVLGVWFRINWLFFVGGLLWFIPMTAIDNPWIMLVSAVLFIVHIVLAFFTRESGEFE